MSVCVNSTYQQKQKHTHRGYYNKATLTSIQSGTCETFFALFRTICAGRFSHCSCVSLCILAAQYCLEQK